jgi:uncharacterized membrane protein
MQRRPIELWRVQRAVLSLLLSSCVCLVLLVMRAFALKEHGFGFIPWNLVLAWIPMLFAFLIYALHTKGARRRSLIVVCAVIWFLFYPNAPYLVTDLGHIRWQPGNPAWFDLLLMMTVAWTGLLLGNISLYLMQEVVEAWRGRTAGWLFAVGMLALGSVGVFVGRFWRWNSGDVLTNPISLASKTNNNLHATSIAQAVVFLATFFAFTSLTYATLYTFVHLRTDSPAGPHDEPPPSPPAEKPVAVRAPLG